MNIDVIQVIIMLGLATLVIIVMAQLVSAHKHRKAKKKQNAKFEKNLNDPNPFVSDYGKPLVKPQRRETHRQSIERRDVQREAMVRSRQSRREDGDDMFIAGAMAHTYMDSGPSSHRSSCDSSPSYSSDSSSSYSSSDSGAGYSGGGDSGGGGGCD